MGSRSMKGKIPLSDSGSDTGHLEVHFEPMYKEVPEVLGIIKTFLEEKGINSIGCFRTLESGVFEEYVVFLNKEGHRRLLFRIWPLLFPHDRRIEYRIYEHDEALRQEILAYLRACAQTNQASLVPKL